MLPENRENLTEYTWWNDFAGNIKLCNTISDYFGWETKQIETAGGVLQFIFTGKEWVSMPHLSYGGIITSENINDLFNKYLPRSSRWQIRYILPLSPYYRNDKVLSYIHLGNKDNLWKSFSQNLRRKIRKSYKNGLIAKHGGTELINDFYDVYTLNMHRLGSPALPKGLIEQLVQYYHDGLQNHAKIFIIYLNSKAIGAALLLISKNSAENILLGSLSEHNQYYTTYMLHWEMMTYALKNNVKTYSLGRSTKDSGVHQYKKQWNTEEIQLYWSYSHPLKKRIKDMSFLSQIWKLVPHRIARFFGPFFAHKLY